MLEFLSPRDINDASQMVGSGSFRGMLHAFLMTPLDGDFDDDGDTDLTDFASIHSCWTGPAGEATKECTSRDIDRNGKIDMRDFQAWQWVFSGS